MARKTKSSGIKVKKQPDSPVALIHFLALLNEVSVSAPVLEFCTPGHKAGRGFEALRSVPELDRFSSEEG
jgi:hypothetical protein